MIPGFFSAAAMRRGTDLWTPASIATHLWLDPADPLSRSVTDSRISQLADKSGNSQHFSQSTTSRRPFLQAGGLGGWDVAAFDGSVGLVATNVSVARAAHEVAFAILLRPDGDVSSDRRVWNSSVGNHVDNARMLIGVRNSRWRVGGRRTDGGAYSENTTVAVTPDTWALLVCCFDYQNASLSIRIDGSPRSSSTFADPGSVSNTNSMRAAYGSGFDANSFHFNGAVAETVVAPSLENVEEIEGYLAHKWGVQNSLPASHPYRDSPPLA